jgi:hypothetical protein
MKIQRLMKKKRCYTVKTFEEHWTIWLAAVWTSSYEILVDIEYKDWANW